MFLCFQYFFDTVKSRPQFIDTTPPTELARKALYEKNIALGIVDIGFASTRVASRRQILEMGLHSNRLL